MRRTIPRQIGFCGARARYAPRMWSALALAFALAMDATAVAAARGLADEPRRELVILPLLFGTFQAGMAALGWLGGAWVSERFAAWAHWVAAGLLVLIGVKMIVEAWRSEGPAVRPGGWLLYLGLAMATSLDAGAAGLTLALLPVAPWLALVLIGAATAICSALAFAGARVLGERVGPRLGLAGGGVLIAIAVTLIVRAV
jgi:manganese efflux pump family protein